MKQINFKAKKLCKISAIGIGLVDLSERKLKIGKIAFSNSKKTGRNIHFFGIG